MQRKRRTPQPGSAMDGFVPRRRTARARQSSLSGMQAPRGNRKMDGFVPRTAPADTHRPVQFTEEPTEKAVPKNEDIINIDDDMQMMQHPLEKPDTTKPRFWEIFKKRRIRKGKPEPSRRKKIIRRTLFVIALIVALVGGFLGWKFLQATSKVFDGNILGFFDTTTLRGEEEGRVNILLAGTSEDDEGHGGADLTDSIMIASIDTRNNTGFTVSIPRDMWVRYGETCSAGYEGKINVAYQCGEDVSFSEEGYFDGGMGLLQKIVTTNFGIPIHYYGKISYTAFQDAVDAVGGIDMTIQTDDPRGIMDRNFDWVCNYQCYKVRYPNGPVHLKGEAALLLARSRGASGNNYGTGNDFGRTERQRDMLVALKSKALSAGVISNPAKLGDLLDAAKDNVQTNFKSNEVRRLYDIAKGIDDEKIESIDLVDPENPLVTTGDYGGQSIVRPLAGINNFSAIKAYFTKLTSNDPVAREGAQVVVLNASGVAGFAQKQADELSQKGLSVSGVGNASGQRSETVVIDLSRGSKSETKKRLEEKFGVTAVAADSYPEAASYPQADFIILVGTQAASSGGQ